MAALTPFALWSTADYGLPVRDLYRELEPTLPGYTTVALNFTCTTAVRTTTCCGVPLQQVCLNSCRRAGFDEGVLVLSWRVTGVPGLTCGLFAEL